MYENFLVDKFTLLVVITMIISLFSWFFKTVNRKVLKYLILYLTLVVNI